ncbi:MAG TPA: proton-conducting transporter membrane subunit [Geminicoccaceae bacterium]|nr:proton-conducting transporter membrane subunit [Geminicoccus sp.]HMU48996.1 proton-conducting transporter membrane subunit [Geminicoccaceae bacterium]
MPPDTTAGGGLLVLALLVPAVGILLALALGGRAAERLALPVMAAGLALALAVTALVLRTDAALVYVVGGWRPPLGIALRADGLSAAMLLTTALVMGGIGLFARHDYRTPAGRAEARLPVSFWTLWLGVWLGLVAVFVGDDLFNLFVALELLTFSAVPLVCLDGRPETLGAALRYLLVALLGSVLYLLGAALLYGAFGTLDIALLAQRIRPGPPVWAALVLMTVGLLAKTALFPLHMWLPPAHAGAPPAASAVLSALVVKASFFLLVRLWVDLLPAMPGPRPAQLLGILGVLAILHGSVLAMRQARLKLLVAYSTVAQIGYLFLIFPIVLAAPVAVGVSAWIGGMVQLVSHACAKAAMFMAAGLIARALGHDRIAGLDGIGRALPLTVLAFALGGLSLMGLPPSGGFVAKWLLATSAVQGGQWWWALAILLGGLLTGGYLFRVLAPAIGGGAVPVPAVPIPRRQELVVLALALASVLLGFLPFYSLQLLAVGRLGGPVAALP